MSDFDLSNCYVCGYIDSKDKFTDLAFIQHPESIECICYACYEEKLYSLIGLKSEQKGQSIVLLPKMKSRQ